MNRGNRKMPIFEDERDRHRFVRIWTEEQEVHGVGTLAGCLMRNHFHGVVETPNANLSDFMEQMEGRFARYSNWRHNHVGHLFQDRYRPVLIEGDVHLLTALCYVFMNPVAAGLATNLNEYKWSTYAATVGLAAAPTYLTSDWLSDMFPNSSLSEAQRRFRELMSQPLPVAAYLRDSELNVGREAIRQVIHSYTGERLNAAQLPHPYRTELRPTLDALIEEHKGDRATFVCEARTLYGYRGPEIAEKLGLRPGTVSAIFCRDRRRRQLVNRTKSA